MSPIQLYRENPATYQREILGSITENQLVFLMENLEEEFDEDMEYFLDPDTLDFLKEQGADATLLTMLKKALAGCPGGVDILYLSE